MTNKVRMKVTVTFEYDADPTHYEGRKPIDMADWDQMGMTDDVGILFDNMADRTLNITVEPINGNP